MIKIGKSTKPNFSPKSFASQRGKIEMPPAKEEELVDYVCALDPRTPFDYVVVGGVDFHKVFDHPDQSFIKNERKRLPKYLPVRALSEKQAKYVLARAGEHIKRIPRKYGYPNDVCNVVDFLILEKESDFDMNSYSSLIPDDYEDEPTERPADNIDEFREKLWSSQSQKNKGVKRGSGK